MGGGRRREESGGRDLARAGTRLCALTVLVLTCRAGPALALKGWTREGDRWIQLVRRGDRKYRQWTNRLAYKLSVPGDYDPRSRRKYPAVVHYHGYGGKNSPTNDPKDCGKVFGTLWKKQKEPIIGVFPQWDGRGWGGAEVSRYLIDILNYEGARLRMDGDRIYLTGQSMGGYGSYFTVTHYPKYFAAVVPISGEWGPYGKSNGTSVPRDLSRWRHLPYWAAHGMKDRTVPYKDDLASVEQMRKGGIYTRFTAYPNGGHHVKQLIYGNQMFFDWLLAQRRGTPHNYELAVDDGNGVRVVGFFEPRTVQEITARAPDKAKGEAFAGWSCAGGSAFEHTTTNPPRSNVRFSSARALTTRFTMPAGDVIVTANYRIDSR